MFVPPAHFDPHSLVQRIREMARALGFQRFGIADIDLEEDAAHLQEWLRHKRHGNMTWMERNSDKRTSPPQLLPGTLRVITVAMDYGNGKDREAWDTLKDGTRAYVARYFYVDKFAEAFDPER
jgi:epoxyqueuosine reductase